MVKNKIYIGKINKELVKFLGIEYDDELKMDLHQFEYITPREKIVGYGQNDEQLKKENYVFCEVGEILYGR